MTNGAVLLIGTIVEIEDHYGTCEVEIDSETAALRRRRCQRCAT